MGAGMDGGLGGRRGGQPGAATGPWGTCELLAFARASAEMPSGGEELETPRHNKTPGMVSPWYGKREKEKAKEAGGGR